MDRGDIGWPNEVEGPVHGRTYKVVFAAVDDDEFLTATEFDVLDACDEHAGVGGDAAARFEQDASPPRDEGPQQGHDLGGVVSGQR